MGSIIILSILIIIFISPIAKYAIEKYDEKYTGREISLGWTYINPFTGYIYLKNFKMYELESDSIFFSSNDISINISMLKLISKTYEISDFVLTKPYGIVIQDTNKFNFNDLLEKFSPKDKDTTSAPVHFNILNVKIKDGEFHYREDVIPINYFIKKVNFESAGKTWDSDTIAAQLSFLPGKGSGDVKADITLNFKTLDYRFATVVNKLDLDIIAQYLNDLTNYGSFSANLDANMKGRGNLKDQQDVASSGFIAINDFHFGKNPEEDYASFDKLHVAIYQLHPKNHKYQYDSISLTRPYFKYEKYDNTDNIQAMFGKKGANIKAVSSDESKFNLVIEIAKYIREMSKNFFKSYYIINHLAVYKGDIKYNDYSLSEKFAIELTPFSLMADSIDRDHKAVNFFLKTGVQPYGGFNIALSINPNKNRDFDIKYHFQKLPIAMFNPYMISYTSFPMDRGTIELNGAWTVRGGNIESRNHILLLDPRVTKKIRNKDLSWIPMPLVMSLIREQGNVIDYEVPIRGNLNDPTFNVKDVLLDLVENIFVKPPTTPYRLEVKNIETEIEKSLSLKWQMKSCALSKTQEKFMNKMVDFLKDNPEAFVHIYPQQYEQKEKEYILFYEAKKTYYKLMHTIKEEAYQEDDSIKVDKMSVKDPLFVKYLNTKIKDTLVFTIQEKCTYIVNLSTVNAKFIQLAKERERKFLSCFIEEGVKKQLKMHAGVNKIPYNGFSFYKIAYESEFPPSLMKAYYEMNILDNKSPRAKFKKERKKNG